MTTLSFSVRRSLILFLALLFFGITGCGKEEKKEPVAKNESGIPGVKIHGNRRRGAANSDSGPRRVVPYRAPSKFTAPTRSRNNRDTAKDVYPEDSMTRKELDKRFVENYYVGIDHYLKRNKVEKKKAKELRAAIESVIQHWRSGGADLKKWKTLYDNYWGLLDKKLKRDPYTGIVLSVIAMERRDFKKAKPLLFDVIMALKQSDYPALVAIWAHELHHVSSRSAGLGTDQNELLREYSAAMIYWITQDLQLSANDDRFVFGRIDQFSDNAFSSGQSTLYYQVSEKIIADTSVPKWVRAMTQAQHQDKLAWKARGNGFANQVSKEGWKQFRKHQTKAAGYYKKALKICPSFPEPCYFMMGVARNGNDKGNDAEYWFNKAIEIQYDYQDAYEEMLFGLLPRWGGSTEKMLDFGRQCYEEGQFDTLVPFQFIEAWRESGISLDLNEERRDKLVNSRKFSLDQCDCMKKIVDNYDKNGTMSHSIDYYRTYLAVCARRAGEHRLASEVFKKMGPRLDKRAVRELGLRESPASFQALSFAVASEFESYANEVVKLAIGNREKRMKNADELIKLADEMLESTVTAKSLSYFRNVRDIAVAEQNYDKGKVVSLKFNKDLTNLMTYSHDQLRFIDEDTVEINTQSGSFSPLVTLKPEFPGAKIIEVDIETTTPKDSRHRFDTWGVVPGKLNGGDAVVAYNAHDSQVKFGGTYYPTLIHYELVPKRSEKVSLKIYAGTRYLEVHVDGQFLMRSRPGQLRMTNLIALCHPYKQVGRGIVQFSNLKIQKWSQGPPPTEAEELVKYYDRAIKKDSENGWNYLWRGHLFHLEKDYEKALEYYEKSIELGTDRTIAGFYAGDCCERLDRTEDALNYYEEIVYDKTLFKDLKPIVFDQRKKLLHPLPAHHVLARYGWHRQTTPGQADRSGKRLTHQYAQLQNLTPKWVRARLRAELIRAHGNTQTAQITLENALVDVPLKYEDAMMKQIDSLKAGKLFKREEGKPFYLDNVDMPKYFPHFDTRLPRTWYQAYH